MSVEHNKELVMRFLNEFMIGQNIKVLDELLGQIFSGFLEYTSPARILSEEDSR